MARRAPAPAAMSDANAFVLADFLPYRLNVLAAVTSDGLSRLYSERFGVTIPEWRVLATLGDRGEATAKAIGASSHMHKTKVSRAVADLIGRGLVRRQSNEADMREALLALTPSGRRLFGAIARLALGYQAKLVDGLSAADRAAVLRALDLLTTRSSALLGEIRGEATEA